MDHRVAQPGETPSRATPIRRLVYVGGPTDDVPVVRSYRVTRLTRPPRVRRVASFVDYLSGCSEHVDCADHMCITSDGVMLLPSRMCSAEGDVLNEPARLARAVFERPGDISTEAYVAGVRKLTLGKEGLLRGGTVGGSVEGSLRTVIVPHWGMCINEIALPRSVAANMCIPTRLEVMRPEGMISSHAYVQRGIDDGDVALIIRPPSLWHGNTQPMRVRLWDESCIGLSPHNCDEYHADFDGDEVHAYPLKDRASVGEASGWRMHTTSKFSKRVVCGDDAASDAMYDTTIMSFMRRANYAWDDMSTQCDTPLGRASRMKASSVVSTMRALRSSRPSPTAYASASQSGIHDIMRQQLTQAVAGMMLRRARIGALSITSDVLARIPREPRRRMEDELDRVITSMVERPDSMAAVRAISAMCGSLQQALLDSHRADKSGVTVTSLVHMALCESSHCMLVMSPGAVPSVSSVWSMCIPGVGVMCIVPHDASLYTRDVVGATSSVILQHIASYHERVRVASVGIVASCAYHGIPIRVTEVVGLAMCMSVASHTTVSPITTTEGLCASECRWLHRVVTSHYGTMARMLESRESCRWQDVESLVECLLMGVLR